MIAINRIKDRIKDLESRKRRIQQMEMDLTANNYNYQTPRRIHNMNVSINRSFNTTGSKTKFDGNGIAKMQYEFNAGVCGYWPNFLPSPPVYTFPLPMISPPFGPHTH